MLRVLARVEPSEITVEHRGVEAVGIDVPASR
jgi:hypothetical protein